MNAKERRIEVLKLFLANLENNEAVSHEEPKTEILINITKEFLDKYTEADLDEIAAREVIYPFYFVFEGRLGLRRKEVILTRSEQAINGFMNAIFNPVFLDDEEWRKELLINVPEKILETGEIDKEKLAQHIELVKHERTTLHEMRSTFAAIKTYIDMVGLQPEIPVILGMEETYGERAEEVNKFMEAVKARAKK